MTQPSEETVKQRTCAEYTAIDILADMGCFPSAGSVPYDVAARAIVAALSAMPSLDGEAMRERAAKVAEDYPHDRSKDIGGAIASRIRALPLSPGEPL